MSEEKRILIIEDDQEISHLLGTILAKSGMNPVHAYSGTEGILQLQQGAFDLILLDLMLPGMSGEDFIDQVRKTSPLPIIVISAKVDVDDKVHVLKMGADDYITKPFSGDEVLARVEVQLRKAALPPSQTQENTWRGLRIHPDRRAASLNNQDIPLTNAEFDILSLLVSNPEKAFSKRKIYENIWQGTYVGDDNTISVHISNLRKKIADVTSEEYIKTIWGVGFTLV